MKPFHLRSECPGEESDIESVVCSAFGSMSEATLVRLMRETHPSFDRRLSVVACDGEQIVGHTLFTPARLRLMGRTIAALGVGPVAVAPSHQKQGAGGAMLGFGHDLGRRLGFELCFLYGGPDYYTRHGYKSCYGWNKVEINLDQLPKPTGKFVRLPVQPADIPWLLAWHSRELTDVDFGWLWGTSLREWAIPGVNSVMWWTSNGRRAGYTMGPPGNWPTPNTKMILADTPELAREIIATLRPTKLDHHPSGWLAKNAFDPAWGKVSAAPAGPALAIELSPGVLKEYEAAVAAGRPVGSAMFPLPFVAC